MGITGTKLYQVQETEPHCGMEQPGRRLGQ